MKEAWKPGSGHYKSPSIRQCGFASEHRSGRERKVCLSELLQRHKSEGCRVQGAAGRHEAEWEESEMILKALTGHPEQHAHEGEWIQMQSCTAAFMEPSRWRCSMDRWNLRLQLSSQGGLKTDFRRHQFMSINAVEGIARGHTQARKRTREENTQVQWGVLCPLPSAPSSFLFS